LKIGIIADTHGLMRPEALAALAGVDHIVHAGDVGGEHVLRALRSIAPVTYVRGNNDEDDGFAIKKITRGGSRIVVTHILPRPRQPRHAVARLLRNADIVIFGHSHLPHDEVIDGVRFFNPASAGPRRFDYPVAVGVIEDGVPLHIALDERSGIALRERMNQLSRR